MNIDATIRLLADTSTDWTRSLDAVGDNVDVLHVAGMTRGLERLPRLKRLRVIWASGVSESQFRQVCAASQITHLHVDFCPFADLAPLRNLSRLRALSLYHNTKPARLDFLTVLTRLQFLSLASFTKSYSLAPVRALEALAFLWLSGTTWTAMRVDSLEPLSRLHRLERLKLSNVRVSDRRLSPLLSLTRLTEIDLPKFFPKREFVALAQAFPRAEGFWLERYREGKA